MRYLILTVLLTVGQASSPIPRQTPYSSTSARTGDQHNTKKKNEPSNTSSSAINQNQSGSTNSDAAQNGSEDTDHPITVGKLPPVTITPAKRDWVDWGYWGFGGLLALTGILQIWLLFRTLRITTRQAEIAERQESQMRAAAQQTERIIAQMKETEVRDLRAYIGVSKVILLAQNIQKPEGIAEFQNFGKTPAYNVRQWIGIAPQSHPLAVTLPESTNPSTASVSTIYPSVKNVLTVRLKKEFPPGTKIGTSQLTLYVYGRVAYDDIIGNHWYTSYRFIFGGPEGGRFYRDENGFLCGAMGPDSEGNHAN